MKKGSPVVLATRNAGKVREFDRLLAGAFHVQPLPQGIALPPETGYTFAANARLKARSVFAALGSTQAVLADDSGLEVTALGGRPGIFSARFAGEQATDAENVAKLLSELEDSRDRSARFVCALCLITPSGLELTGGSAPPGTAAVRGSASPGDAVVVGEVLEVDGITEGSIALAPRGDDGFGYDPVFLPDGWNLTLAEASPADKDGVSHRGAAARELLQNLSFDGDI